MARYRLLRDECRRRGILHLLLAHHADDQAETVAMRAARRSGPDGLAGMAALVDQPEVRLLRPLLGCIARPAYRHASRARRAVAGRPVECRSALRAGAAAGERLPSTRAVGRRRRRERAARDGKLARAAVDMLAFDPAGTAAIDQGRICAPGLRSAGEAAQPGHPGGRRAGLSAAPASVWSGRPAGFAHPWTRGKSGKRQDFTLSGCKLMLRRVPDRRQLHWIVRPEHGRNMSQPLIPAAFFACGTPAASHLE